MGTQTRLVTADELFAMGASGERFELIRGELVEMTPPGGPHGRVTSRIDRRLGTHVEQNDLGEVFANDTGFWIERDPDTVRGPDLAFVAKSRVPPEGIEDGYVQVMPDLVVEVVSPSDSASEVQAKVEAWLRAGAQLAWVAYPKQRSVVFHSASGQGRVLFENDTLDGGAIVPGFKCRVGDLF